MDAARNLGGPHPPADQLKALRKITRAAQLTKRKKSYAKVRDGFHLAAVEGCACEA